MFEDGKLSLKPLKTIKNQIKMDLQVIKCQQNAHNLLGTQ